MRSQKSKLTNPHKTERDSKNAGTELKATDGTGPIVVFTALTSLLLLLIKLLKLMSRLIFHLVKCQSFSHSFLFFE